MGTKQGYESYNVYSDMWFLRPRRIAVDVCEALGTRPPQVIVYSGQRLV